MGRRLGVGVISLGWMGRLHTRSYRALREVYPDLDVEIDLVAAADPVADYRSEATSRLGFGEAVADYHELLADPRVDMVSICAPNHLHHEMAMAAIAAGKPLWIEKPMGISADQAREIAAAAAAAGVVTCAGFNYRHVPAVVAARDLIAQGRLGRITNVRSWWIADYASDPDGPLTWRYDQERAGSGLIGDLLSHGADLLTHMVGPISDVCALTGTFIADRPIPTKIGLGHAGWEVSEERGPVGNEDYGALLLRFADGVVGTMEGSRVSVGPRADYGLEVYGTDGSLRWNLEQMNELQVCLGRTSGGYTRIVSGPGVGDYGRFQPSAGTPMGFDDLKTIQAALFVESVLSGAQVGPSVHDAWVAAEVDHAALASAADGAWHQVRAAAAGRSGSSQAAAAGRSG